MATATKNPEPIPGFDAVNESRKWREATSRMLEEMGTDERLEYLDEARKRYLARCDGTGFGVREDPPKP